MKLLWKQYHAWRIKKSFDMNSCVLKRRHFSNAGHCSKYLNAWRTGEQDQKKKEACPPKAARLVTLCGMLSACVILLHDNTQPHTARWSTHIPQEFSWEEFNHTPYSPNLHAQWFSSFLTPQEIPVWSNISIFQMTETQRWVLHNGSNPGSRLLRHRDTKVGPTKNGSTHSVSVPINLSIKLGI